MNENVKPLTNKWRIALGIPVIDSVPGECYGSHLILAAEIAQLAELALFVPFNTMPHDAARMDVVDGAISTECDYLLFVDDDMLIPKGAFDALFKTMRETGAKVVSGHYSRRGWEYTCVWSKVVDGKFERVDALEGIHEIDCSGLGCALIDLRWVVDNMKPPFFRMLHNGRHTSVTDDVTFFEDVRKAGGLILGHAGVRCGHFGARQLIDDSTLVPLRQMYLRAEKTYENKHGCVVKDIETVKE
jgi:hypothetical protein